MTRNLTPSPPDGGRRGGGRESSLAMQQLLPDSLIHTTTFIEVESDESGKPLRISAQLVEGPVSRLLSGRDSLPRCVRTKKFVLTWYPNRVEVYREIDDDGTTSKGETLHRGGGNLKHLSQAKVREIGLQGLQTAIPRALKTWCKAMEAAMEVK